MAPGGFQAYALTTLLLPSLPSNILSLSLPADCIISARASFPSGFLQRCEQEGIVAEVASPWLSIGHYLPGRAVGLCSFHCPSLEYGVLQHYSSPLLGKSGSHGEHFHLRDTPLPGQPHGSGRTALEIRCPCCSLLSALSVHAGLSSCWKCSCMSTGEPGHSPAGYICPSPGL